MTAQQMRDHAEECRTVAGYNIGFDTKRIWLDLAVTWEKMAAQKDNDTQDRPARDCAKTRL